MHYDWLAITAVISQVIAVGFIVYLLLGDKKTTIKRSSRKTAKK